MRTEKIDAVLTHKVWALPVFFLLALGLPVLAVECSGVREQLGMGRFGRIVENHDEALAGGMEDFLSGRESCEDWRERAARGGDAVAYERAVRKVEHLLEEMK